MTGKTGPSSQWVGRRLVELGIRRSGSVILAALVAAVVLGALMVRVETDTDPENMLPGDHSVRVLNGSLRDDFGTGDILALGIIDEGGVTNPEVLTAAAELTRQIETLDGLVPGSVVSFASALEIGEGPVSAGQADEIVAAVEANPLLRGRVISPDGTAIGIFATLESEGQAADLAADMKDFAAGHREFDGTDVYTAGLPLAQDQFGRDMFVQMALLAPLAGLLIFLLMWWFFRRLTLVASAMALAMLTVIWTMGLLIGTGFSLHIMSSMIPVFLMPIAILDSIHVLSEFFDRYPRHRDREAALHEVYRELFIPLTYTSITTAVAFASLMLVPIPPVRVFGGFVAVGVGAAWLLSVVFLPALIMRLDEARLLRLVDKAGGREGDGGLLPVGLRRLRGLTTRRPRMVLAAFVVVTLAAIPGIVGITVNDNPVRWFRSGTEIREATEVLNESFAGVYNASLVLDADDAGALVHPDTVDAIGALRQAWAEMEVVGSTATYLDMVGDGTTPMTGGSLTTALHEAAGGPDASFVASLIMSDLQRANVQLLMRDGDNQSMQDVVDVTSAQLARQPLADGVTATWAGETYLNLVWQDEMVSGMLLAFFGTLVVVLILMTALFRSLRWALLAMVPVLLSVVIVYGAAGWMGKEYDMPMAVLSTLVLGIGVDFAIHFVQRYRDLLIEMGSAAGALERFYEEPARALTRNAFVIALGFLPMFASSLTPYLIVAAFLASIMALSWLSTLLVLPAMVMIGSGEKIPSLRAPATTSIR